MRCVSCRRVVASYEERYRQVWCLDCLARHPEATFGQRLKALRLAAGLTKIQLREAAGLSPGRIRYYEADQELQEAKEDVKTSPAPLRRFRMVRWMSPKIWVASNVLPPPVGTLMQKVGKSLPRAFFRSL